MNDILLWANTKDTMKFLTQKIFRINCSIHLNKGICQFAKTKLKSLGYLFTSGIRKRLSLVRDKST